MTAGCVEDYAHGPADRLQAVLLMETDGCRLVAGKAADGGDRARARRARSAPAHD